MKFPLLISILCKTEWSWELSTWSGKMREIDISTNSPHYFYWKSIGTVNENLNFDIRVLRVKPPSPDIKDSCDRWTEGASDEVYSVRHIHTIPRPRPFELIEHHTVTKGTLSSQLATTSLRENVLTRRNNLLDYSLGFIDYSLLVSRGKEFSWLAWAVSSFSFALLHSCDVILAV